MSTKGFSRRSFVLGLVAARGLMAAQPEASGEQRSVRLGGPVFARTDDPEELARAHVKQGYRAAYCPGISLSDSARISATAASNS